ncbi:hypothetical protein [Pseudomonas rhodesiae]|nr:hypothetical protein [Pseudomonas rhodesiae]WLG37553.1 hypothetical protein PSH93_16265 [Pseudomonas rhodesiae]
MGKNIIVIGGESSEDMQRMTRIDEYIVASSGKAHPTVSISPPPTATTV